GARAPPAFVVASAAAFLLSEFADLAVYTPLVRRGLVLAVVASSVVGLVVDSVVFLWLAFGSLDFLPGQIVGKAWMVLLSIPFVAWLRRRAERLGLLPPWGRPRPFWQWGCESMRVFTTTCRGSRPRPAPPCC